MTDYAHIASMLFETPLLISQAKLDVILSVLSPRLGIEAPAGGVGAELDWTPERAAQMQAARLLEMEAAAMAVGAKVERTDAGYYLVGNTAVVPVMGTLVHRGGWMQAMSGMQSYQATRSMHAAAIDDYRVENILMEFDTPGGSVAGVFDLADYMHAARGKKHTVAHVNEMAASAGYLLAATADEIVLSRTAVAGSIGVVMAHVDRSKALDKQGLSVTYIYAGDKKVDGNPTEPLKPRAKRDLQAKVDSTYDLFVETVARSRGMKADAVRATEAGVFMGQEAVDAGLADRVEPFSDALQSIVSRKGARSSRSLSHQQEIPEVANPNEPTQSAEQLSAARAEGHANGVKDGVSAERDRIKAITGHAEAEGRGELAAHLAYETSMSVDEAVALLGKSPKAAAPAPVAAQSPLERAMDVNGTPGLTNITPAAPKAGSVWDHAVTKLGGK